MLSQADIPLRYWKDPYFNALDIIRDAASKAGLTMAEVALRWISNHSLMDPQYGDSVLIGASSLTHIEQASSRVSMFISI